MKKLLNTITNQEKNQKEERKMEKTINNNQNNMMVINRKNFLILESMREDREEYLYLDDKTIIKINNKGGNMPQVKTKKYFNKLLNFYKKLKHLHNLTIENSSVSIIFNKNNNSLKPIWKYNTNDKNIPMSIKDKITYVNINKRLHLAFFPINIYTTHSVKFSHIAVNHNILDKQQISQIFDLIFNTINKQKIKGFNKEVFQDMFINILDNNLQYLVFYTNISTNIINVLNREKPIYKSVNNFEIPMINYNIGLLDKNKRYFSILHFNSKKSIYRLKEIYLNDNDIKNTEKINNFKKQYKENKINIILSNIFFLYKNNIIPKEKLNNRELEYINRAEKNIANKDVDTETTTNKISHIVSEEDIFKNILTEEL